MLPVRIPLFKELFNSPAVIVIPSKYLFINSSSASARASIVFSRYFRRYPTRFGDVEQLIGGDWRQPALLEMLKEFMDHIPKELIRERKMPDGSIIREGGPIIWGYSMTIKDDGKPVIREFGNLKPSVQRLPGELPFSLKEEREPLVDVVETDGEVRIVAELPGIEKEDINLYATSSTL
ncbi:MAG: hypothetical protein ABIK18_06545, partial [candidate division WOR-3 bacterium]